MKTQQLNEYKSRERERDRESKITECVHIECKCECCESTARLILFSTFFVVVVPSTNTSNNNSIKIYFVLQNVREVKWSLERAIEFRSYFKRMILIVIKVFPVS